MASGHALSRPAPSQAADAGSVLSGRVTRAKIQRIARRTRRCHCGVNRLMGACRTVQAGVSRYRSKGECRRCRFDNAERHPGEVAYTCLVKVAGRADLREGRAGDPRYNDRKGCQTNNARPHRCLPLASHSSRRGAPTIIRVKAVNRTAASPGNADGLSAPRPASSCDAPRKHEGSAARPQAGGRCCLSDGHGRLGLADQRAELVRMTSLEALTSPPRHEDLT